MKNEITRVAMHLFARKGFAATSMREIAEQASVTKAALYHHFPDKETLYREAMTTTLQHLCVPIAEAAAGIDDAAARLRAIVHAHMALFVKESDLIRALYHNILMPDSSFHPEEYDDEPPLLGALRACAAEGILPSKQVRDVALLLMGAIEYVGVGWLIKERGLKPTPALGDRLLMAAIPDFPLDRVKKSRGRSVATGARAASRKARQWITAIGIGAAATLGPAMVTAQPALEGDTVTLEPGEIDAIEGATETISLATCVQVALDANNALQAQRQGREEVKGQVWQAASTGLPSLDLAGNWTRFRDPSFALNEAIGGMIPPGAVPAQTYWRTDLSTSWELNPVLIANAVKAAHLGERRQEAIIFDAENRVTEDTMIAYYSVLAQNAALIAVDAEVEQRQEFLDITRRRFNLGFSTPLDTLQAAVALANLIPIRRNTEFGLRIAGGELNVLMGHTPDRPLRVARDIDVELDEVDPDMVDVLAERRPDVEQIEILRLIQEKNRGAQKSELRPYVSIFGSYGFVALEADDLFKSDQDVWTASVSLNIPLWDGFLTKGRVKETTAIIERLKFDRREAERQARLEARVVLGQLEVARDNYEVARLNMDRAEEALASTTLRYDNGKSNYLAVLNAQTDRFDARRNLIQAGFDVFSSTASLKRAMGLSPLQSLEDARRAWASDEQRSQ